MIIMKKNLRTIPFTLFLAAAAVSASYADSRSDAMLKELSQKITLLGNYRVEFTVSAEGNSVEGQYIVSGDKYYMDIGDIEVVCDGKTKYEINHFDDEVIIDNVDPKDRNILSNPTRAFDFADESFTHTYKGEVDEGGNVCNVILLEPRDKGTSLIGVTLLINKTTGLPYMLKYLADGLDGEVEVSILKITPDVKVPASRFTFDRKAYRDKNYELIDFRYSKSLSR